MAQDDIQPAQTSPRPDVASIFMAHRRTLLSFVERRVGSHAVAEDLLQEAFVRGMDKLDVRDDQSVVAWFHQTLRNAAVDYHRRNQSASKVLQAFAAESADRAEPDDRLRKAVCACVRSLADGLKPELSVALQRVELDGVPVKEFAREAGITPGNAAVRLFRARQALRKQVVHSCGACAEGGCDDCTCAPPAGASGPVGS